MTLKIHSLVAVRDDTGSTTDSTRRQAATRREEDALDLHPSLVEQPWIPQRLVQAQPHHFLRWTFLQRKVFALTDGARTTHSIAWMLSTSPKRVTQTLRQLQAMGMIARETYDEQ